MINIKSDLFNFTMMNSDIVFFLEHCRLISGFSEGFADQHLRGVIKKFSARYALVRFIELKSLSVVEGHWECETHVVMLGCFICKAILREEGKWRNFKSEQLSSTSVRKECLPRKFMKTSWKPLGRCLLPKAQSKIRQQGL